MESGEPLGTLLNSEIMFDWHNLFALTKI
jgi:hypothetical protein